MVELYVLWIMIGVGNNRTLALDHYQTKQECDAARTSFLSDFNTVHEYWFDKLDGTEARCVKVEVK